jgi:hypothetical protein
VRFFPFSFAKIRLRNFLLQSFVSILHMLQMPALNSEQSIPKAPKEEQLARIHSPFWTEKIRGFRRKSAPPYFNVHEFTSLVGLWSYFPTNPRLSNWLWMRAKIIESNFTDQEACKRFAKNRFSLANEVYAYLLFFRRFFLCLMILLCVCNGYAYIGTVYDERDVEMYSLYNKAHCKPVPLLILCFFLYMLQVNNHFALQHGYVWDWIRTVEQQLPFHIISL